MDNPFLTASLTIIGGVTIFCITQFILKFILEPIYEQRKVIGEIAESLSFYANVIANPGPENSAKHKDAQVKLRQLSTLFRSRSSIIPYYEMWEKLRFINPIKNIREVSTELIYLSNSVFRRSEESAENSIICNARSVDRIKDLLKLEL